MKAYLKETITIPFILNDSASAATLKIMRLSDGFWLDFNDSTFKNSAWTSDTAAMTADSNNVWKYSWTIPQLEDKYQIIFINSDNGFSYTGPLIEAIGNISFTVQTDGANSTTTFKTDLSETTSDFFITPTLIKFLTGNNKGIVRKLPASNSYNGTTKFFMVSTAFPYIPQAGDKAIVIIS